MLFFWEPINLIIPNFNGIAEFYRILENTKDFTKLVPLISSFSVNILISLN